MYMYVYLSKGHRSFSPWVLPPREVVNAETVDVGLVDLPVDRKGGRKGGREGGREGG